VNADRLRGINDVGTDVERLPIRTSEIVADLLRQIVRHMLLKGQREELACVLCQLAEDNQRCLQFQKMLLRRSAEPRKMLQRHLKHRRRVFS
jgi:hypothetical protein